MAIDLSSVRKHDDEKIQCGQVTNKDPGWMKELMALGLSCHKQRPKADERINGFRP